MMIHALEDLLPIDSNLHLKVLTFSKPNTNGTKGIVSMPSFQALRFSL